MSGDAVPAAADAGAEPVWCARCGTDYPGAYMCPKHGDPLQPRPAPAADAAPGAPGAPGGGVDQRPRRVCWKCDEESPNPRNPDCLNCHESLTPPVLVVEFAGGLVVVRRPGESVELGRAGPFDYVFDRYPNVSRRHATIGVDASGQAWLTPNPAAPNGTFVNDTEILERAGIGPADQIRFATDRGPQIGPISSRIRRPHLEPVRRPQP